MKSVRVLLDVGKGSFRNLMTALVTAIYELLKNLPAILQLIQNLQVRIAQMNTDKKVADDLAKIQEAFEKEDSSILDHIFSGTK
jgi:hypothetical protein